MRRPLRLLALDLGAESGRALVGAFDGSRLAIGEAHRFPNVPVRMHGTLHWDFLRLFGDVLAGIRAAQAQGEIASLGVDTWGVDFGLLDARGRLLGNPVHYRDARTAGMLERAEAKVPRERIYTSTGIQLMPINTLYQLLTMVESADPELERADRLLLMADLVNHFLCGSNVSEYTNASTSQCFDMVNGRWAVELLSEFRIPTRILPEVVGPGSVLGWLDPEVASDVGAKIEVVAPGTHDTASAVAATPLDGETAFLSSGTWSLLGLELDRPIVTVAAGERNLTNEGGVAGTIRLLKNVMGLWLVQQARRACGLSYEQLTAQASVATPLTAFIDPDDERFLRVSASELGTAVSEFCAETAQPSPSDVGALVRVILESLALKYAVVLRELESVSGRTVRAIRVVGGGSNNALLCQLTADASGLPVLAGPAEATSIGNLIVQAMALGELGSLADARALVAESFPARAYEPAGDWSEARSRFDAILDRRHENIGVVQ